MASTTVFTYQLNNGSMVISASQNVVRLSVLCKSGTITFQGNAMWNGLSSTTNSVSAGQGFSITAASVANPLDGITITATASDYAEVMLTFQ